MQRNCHELAVMESIESGKPLRDSARIDFEASTEAMTCHAEAVDNMHDESASEDECACE